MSTERYFIIYKPYGMLSQFTADSASKNTALSELKFDFPKDAYPVGRLDADSEGLLIITNDKTLNVKLLHPSNMHMRTYYAQVDQLITEEACKKLEKGITITIDGTSYHTLPAKALVIDSPELPPRNPPVRYRAEIPTSWLKLTLHEGKNRQVRKMTAAVGFPTLRLVRWSIEDLTLEGLEPGNVKELKKEELHKKLKIR